MLLTTLLIFVVLVGVAKVMRLPWWTAVVGAVYFALRRWGLAVFDEVDVWWIVLGAVTAPWWLGPLVIKGTQKLPAQPSFEPFQPGADPLPSDLATAIEDLTVSLERAGFRTLGDFLQVGGAANVRTRVILLEEPSSGDQAIAVAMYTTGKQARMATGYVELMAKFADGRTVLASNTAQPSAFAPVPGKTSLRLPQVRDPARLYRLFRAYLDRYYPGVGRERPDIAGGPAAYLAQGVVREYDEQVALGYLTYDAKAGAYHPTWKGAAAMTWKLLPPASWVVKARMRRSAEALVRELDAAGHDERPVAEVKGSHVLSWQVAVVVALFAAFFLFGDQVRTVLARAGAAARPRTVLPDDFAVPPDFAGAVRALETLAGTPASPVVGLDSLGDTIATPGLEVTVPARRADAFLAAAAPKFAERGFLLVRHDQTYGIGGEPERLALFPGRDPYEIMALLGTNGANYEIGTGRIITWLSALEQEHPFTITGIGYDHVEGRFLRRPSPDEARALADRFYAFCPDIVDQGTGTTVALAAEFSRTGRLYCWWD